MSERFKDRAGNEWTIELTIGTVERVRKTSRFNLWEQAEPLADEPGQPPKPNAKPLCEALYGNYPLLWELLWFLIEPQAEAQGVTAEAFGAAMGPEALVQAEQAFYREWQDFFLRLRRSDCSAVLQKMTTYREAAILALETRLQDPRVAEMDAEVKTGIDQLAEQQLAKALSDGSGKLRELLASDPSNSPG